MDQIKFNGFPPLIPIVQKDESSKTTKSTQLKPQFFSKVKRQNINIREILSKNTDLFDDSDDEKLTEVSDI